MEHTHIHFRSTSLAETRLCRFAGEGGERGGRPADRPADKAEGEKRAAEREKVARESKLREELLKLKREIEQGNAKRDETADAKKARVEQEKAKISGLIDQLKAADPEFVRTLPPNTLKALEDALSDPAVAGPRGELLKALSAVRPGESSEVFGVDLSKGALGVEQGIQKFATDKLAKNDMIRSTIESINKATGLKLTVEGAVGMIFSAIRAFVATKLSTTYIGMLEGSDAMNQARAVGKEMNYRMGLEGYAKMLKIKVEDVRSMSTTDLASLVLGVDKDKIEGDWSKLYDRWQTLLVTLRSSGSKVKLPPSPNLTMFAPGKEALKKQYEDVLTRFEGTTRVTPPAEKRDVDVGNFKFPKGDPVEVVTKIEAVHNSKAVIFEKNATTKVVTLKMVDGYAYEIRMAGKLADATGVKLRAPNPVSTNTGDVEIVLDNGSAVKLSVLEAALDGDRDKGAARKKKIAVGPGGTVTLES